MHNQDQNSQGDNRNRQRESREEDQVLQSQTFSTDKRKYFLDIKENSKGRFLKISETKPGFRSAIFVEEESIIEFYDRLQKLLVDAGDLELV